MMAGAALRITHEFATVSMDTWVNVKVVSSQSRAQVEPAVQRALGWFDTVERACTRFDPSSEVMRLLEHVGQPVKVSTLLLEAAAFAVDLAAETDGAFDPTLGAALEQLGHARNYRTDEIVRSDVDATKGTFRDVRVDRRKRTLLLRRPVVLDLNAVAKGLAIDLAVQALAEYQDLCIEAGGDLYVRGHNQAAQQWLVGIQHPRAEGLLAETLRVSDVAVCTSGDYERGGHVLDGRSRAAAADLSSVSVIAPTAMAADGLSTAAMALGRERGRDFLTSQGVAAILITADGTLIRFGDPEEGALAC